jgi:hypothetical protein
VHSGALKRNLQSAFAPAAEKGQKEKVMITLNDLGPNEKVMITLNDLTVTQKAQEEAAAARMMVHVVCSTALSPCAFGSSET